MCETEIRVHTPDGEMRTFVAHPEEEGPYPVAIVYMDAPGYREAVKQNARRFAADGYYVVVPDLFYRAGEVWFDRSQMTDEDRERMMSLVRSIDPDAVLADTEAVFEAIADDPAAAKGPSVCVGYCMGARLALHAAAAKPEAIVAAAGAHPGALVNDQPDSPHHDVPKVRGELYFAFAENDRSATAENVKLFRQELERNGVRGTVERLPGTHHGFAMADLEVYDADAAEHHFERTLDLWRRNL
jgi:carboxymethylenebutenolidase